jgi:hypothetical protein
MTAAPPSSPSYSFAPLTTSEPPVTPAPPVLLSLPQASCVSESANITHSPILKTPLESSKLSYSGKDFEKLCLRFEALERKEVATRKRLEKEYLAFLDFEYEFSNLPRKISPKVPTKKITVKVEDNDPSRTLAPSGVENYSSSGCGTSVAKHGSRGDFSSTSHFFSASPEESQYGVTLLQPTPPSNFNGEGEKNKDTAVVYPYSWVSSSSQLCSSSSSLSSFSAHHTSPTAPVEIIHSTVPPFRMTSGHLHFSTPHYISLPDISLQQVLLPAATYKSDL